MIELKTVVRICRPAKYRQRSGPFLVSMALLALAQFIPTQKCNAAPQPLCGIYCVYCAAKLEGRKIDLADLMQVRYVGDTNGSSINELQRAAMEHGLNALPLDNMTGDTLRSSPYPIILHVKGGVLSTGFDHFILMLWCRNGIAKIIDPMSGASQIPIAHLESMWDGAGLVTSAGAIDIGLLEKPVWETYILVSLSIISLYFILFRCRILGNLENDRPKSGRFVWEIGGLLFAACVLAFVCEYILPDGLLRNWDSVASVQKDHAFSFLPRLTTSNAAKKMHEGITFIDARMESDYKVGHIQNAINLPVNASRARFSAIVQGIPKDNELVVYCQSRGCPYSKLVVTSLMANGYKKISIFPGGWLEWDAANGSRPQ